MPQHMCQGQRTTCRRCFPPSIIRVPGIKPRLSGLVMSVLTTEQSRSPQEEIVLLKPFPIGHSELFPDVTLQSFSHSSHSVLGSQINSTGVIWKLLWKCNFSGYRQSNRLGSEGILGHLDFHVFHCFLLLRQKYCAKEGQGTKGLFQLTVPGHSPWQQGSDRWQELGGCQFHTICNQEWKTMDAYMLVFGWLSPLLHSLGSPCLGNGAALND